MISINGMNIYTGRNITIRNNQVIIDGVDVTPDSKQIKIEVIGSIDSIRADRL
jgi:hypothetical protein